MLTASTTGAVLIMSAVAEELSRLDEVFDERAQIDVGGHRFRSGTIDGHDVVVAVAGIGKVNAAMVATLGIDRFRPRMVVFTGVAGALDESLTIGDVIIADHTVHHDTGVLLPDGLHRYQSGHVPFVNPTDQFGYETSPDLVERTRMAADAVSLSPVLDRRPRIVLGRLATGDQFVQSEPERLRLRQDVGALAVEMEGAAVAQIAEHFSVDLLLIRAVSDLAGSESDVDFARFVDEAAANSMKVLRSVLEVV